MPDRKEDALKVPGWGKKGGSFVVSDDAQVIEDMLSAHVFDQGILDKRALNKLSLDLSKAGVHIGFSALSAGKSVDHAQYHYTMEDPQAVIFGLSGIFARAGMPDLGDIRDLITALDQRGISLIPKDHPVIRAASQKNREITASPTFS